MNFLLRQGEHRHCLHYALTPNPFMKCMHVDTRSVDHENRHYILNSSV